ncbi:hypothetical protein CF15_08420 [Pyrodictium occultum]|uniref:Uncharacterized protein n=1 Tax=Pyrodictium occultum TaxID=2309 RepID=A0A0V8RRQ4_PYROC|nr:hypothetical protein CF15_08420 [Pyrodictium occultum]
MAALLAGVFIVVLTLELIAMFSPALLGLVGSRRHRYSVTVYAPAGMEQQAALLARQVAARLGVKDYRVEPVAANSSSGLMSVVLYDKGEPVLVLFTSSVEGISSLVYQLASQLLPRVEQNATLRNATLLYAGSAGIFLLPKNATFVDQFVRSIISSHASTESSTSSNTTSTAANATAPG